MAEKHIETKADLLLDLILSRKRITLEEATRIMKMPESIVEECANAMREEKLINIEYGLGGVIFKPPSKETSEDRIDSSPMAKSPKAEQPKKRPEPKETPEEIESEKEARKKFLEEEREKMKKDKIEASKKKKAEKKNRKKERKQQEEEEKRRREEEEIAEREHMKAKRKREQEQIEKLAKETPEEVPIIREEKRKGSLDDMPLPSHEESPHKEEPTKESKSKNKVKLDRKERKRMKKIEKMKEKERKERLERHVPIKDVIERKYDDEKKLRKSLERKDESVEESVQKLKELEMKLAEDAMIKKKGQMQLDGLFRLTDRIDEMIERIENDDFGHPVLNKKSKERLVKNVKKNLEDIYDD